MARRADFVIGVNGQSMEPSYRDGDKVFVEKADEIPTGGIGVFLCGNECFIKELGNDRLISHHSDKDRYPDIPASEDMRCAGLVLGKVEEDYIAAKYAYPAIFTPESNGGYSINFPDLDSRMVE